MNQDTGNSTGVGVEKDISERQIQILKKLKPHWKMLRK